MGYAIKGAQWRSVDNKSDCTKEETFSEIQPLPIVEDPQVTINKIARDYLRKTDWYVIRNIETGEPIPEEISEKRFEARTSIIEV